MYACSVAIFKIFIIFHPMQTEDQGGAGSSSGSEKGSGTRITRSQRGSGGGGNSSSAEESTTGILMNGVQISM